MFQAYKVVQFGAVVRVPSPTNVTWVLFLVPGSYVGWVCCWFSSLLRRFFSGFFGFPPSAKTNISKFDLESVDEKPLCGDATARIQFVYLIYLQFKWTALCFSLVEN